MTVLSERRQLYLLIALWCGVLGALTLPHHYLREVDSHFHAQVATIMAERGLTFQDFPYAVESVWAERYFDKEWLFHVLLVPFVSVNKLVGPQVFVLVMNAVVVVGLWQFCQAVGFHRCFWWLALIPYAVLAEYLMRLVVCRPLVLSVGLLFLALALVIRRRPWLLALVSAVYALSYTGHWQLLGLVLVYDVVYMLLRDNGHFRNTWLRCLPMTVPVAVGIAVGELVHPHFPRNLYGLVVQNILILKDYWAGTAAQVIREQPLEARPFTLEQFCCYLAPLWVGLAVVAVGAWRYRRLSRDQLLLASYVGIYLVLTLRVQKFVEYLVPLTVVLVGWYCSEHELLGRLRRPALRYALIGALLLSVGLNLWMDMVNAIRFRRLCGNQPQWAEAGQQIAAHASPGEIVFTAVWSETPQLFFLAPRQRYLVFLDPYFWYLRSPERYRLYGEVVNGRSTDPVSVILGVFNSRIVFSENRPDRFRFLDQLAADPRAMLICQSQTPYGGILFFLRPAAPPRTAEPPASAPATAPTPSASGG